MTAPSLPLITPTPLRTALAVAGLGVLIFVVMDVTMKALGTRYPVPQIVATRFAGGCLLACLLAAIQQAGRLRPDTIRANSIRAVLSAISAITFFSALSILPIAEALTLTFLAPLFMALLAAAMLGERLNRTILAAIALGFAGVLVIVFEKLSEAGGAKVDVLGVMLALASACSYALQMVMMRQRAKSDRIAHMLIVQNGVAALVVGPVSLAFVTWLPMTPADWGLLGLCALLGTTAQYAMGWAYGRAPAARVGVMEYTALLWGGGLGYLVFHEIPTLATYTGAALIVGACVVASRRG